MLVFISDYIKLNVKNILKKENILEEDYNISFRKHWFSIIFTGKSEINSDIVDKLKDCFDNQIVLIKIDGENHIVIDVHVFDGCPALYKEV